MSGTDEIHRRLMSSPKIASAVVEPVLRVIVMFSDPYRRNEVFVGTEDETNAFVARLTGEGREP